MSGQGTAVAGGVIAAALLDVLVENNIMTVDQARMVLDRARAKLVIFSGSEKHEAENVLRSVNEWVTRSR